MAVTLRQIEGAPTAWPTVTGLSSPAAALSQGAIWQRIECFTSWRFAAREVVWLVEGGGDWQPPLTPAVLSKAELWQGGAWQVCSPEPSPWGGYDLSSFAPYRITATVGAGPLPDAVGEAFRRLAEYLAASSAVPVGASIYASTMGPISERIEVSPSHIARALQNSGAADLLRQYRRV